MYIKNPKKIESNSMDIIAPYLSDVTFTERELPIVCLLYTSDAAYD